MEDQNQFFIQLNKFLESEQGNLPIFSAVSLQLQLELIKNDPDIKIVEKLIVADQSLSSTVLRIANSVRYRGFVETTTIKSAIVRLGMSEIMRIVSADMSSKIFSSNDSQINAIMKKLWQHAVGCAFAAGILSNSTACGLVQEEAFTAGLFHDIGKLLILKVVEEKKKKYKLFAIPNELLFEAMESLHAKHGYRLLNRIKLPKMYALVARDHHLQTYNRDNLLLVLVKLANAICHQMGIGCVSNPSLDIMGSEEARLLNLTESDLDTVRKYLLNTTNLME